MNNKMFDMVFNLKFQAKQLNRQATKCEKDEKVEKDKAFKAMKKNNMDGAQIHASNAIRLHNENLQFLRISSQYAPPDFTDLAIVLLWLSCI
jgi:charged multivesicular body protein 1